jgi:hypothetical protein
MLVRTEPDRQAIVYVVNDEQNAANVDKGGIGGTIRLNNFVLDFHFQVSFLRFDDPSITRKLKDFQKRNPAQCGVICQANSAISS